MTHSRNSKWPQVIADLQASPGELKKVADDAGPSTIQRLRALGAEVILDSNAPRTKDTSYSRYTVWARWPTPQTEADKLTLELSDLTHQLAEIRKDLDAAEEEYIADKKRLNRSAYRRKQIRERYEPVLEQHDLLTARLNQSKTEKD